MARKKEESSAPLPPFVVKAHSYVEITFPSAVESYRDFTGQYYKKDFVKHLPREEAIAFARAIEQASKEVL